MNAITPLSKWSEGRNHRLEEEADKMEGKKKKEKWYVKCTRSDLNGKTVTKREEKTALKHPPPHLYSSSLGLADQFPLDIDYCYNCTILITCPLESLSLSPFLAYLTALHFSLFISFGLDF